MSGLREEQESDGTINTLADRSLSALPGASEAALEGLLFIRCTKEGSTG
jgi:hypothetical protein